MKMVWEIKTKFFLFIKIAGAVSSAIATPTDVLKVRMQVHGCGTDQNGMIGCFRNIYRYEGVSGLWKGVSPTAQRGKLLCLLFNFLFLLS